MMALAWYRAVVRVELGQVVCAWQRVPRGGGLRWCLCAQGAGVVSLSLEGGVCGIIVGEGGVGVDVFGMAAGIFTAFA